MTTSPCLPSRLLATPPDLLPRLLTGLMTGVLTGALPVLLGISLLLPAGAQASSVWRCESGGWVTYADQPCDQVTSPSTGGTMAQRSVEVDDRRTADQRREAQKVAQMDERLLARLQQERRLREKEAPKPAAAAIIGLPPDPLAKPSLSATAKAPGQKPHRPAPQGGLSGARTSRATAPGSPRAAG